MIWHSTKERPIRSAVLMTLKYERKPNEFIFAILNPRKFEEDFLWEIFADNFTAWCYYTDYIKQIAERNKNEHNNIVNSN